MLSVSCVVTCLQVSGMLDSTGSGSGIRPTIGYTDREATKTSLR